MARRDSETRGTAGTPAKERSHPSPGLRSFVSFLVFVHLFCVFWALSANNEPSRLQSRLMTVLRPYTQLISLDPNFTRYQLTYGIPRHDDHVIEVDIPAAEGGSPETLVLPDAGWRGGARRMRYRAMAYVVAFTAEEGNADAAAEMARAIGGHVMAERKIDRVVVRCRRHQSIPFDPAENPVAGATDPADPRYFATVYEADVFRSPDGSVNVIRRADRLETAPGGQQGTTP
jgi:hypothetical protein